MRRRILALTIAATLFGAVAAQALAQNSELSPAAAAPMKSKPKPKTPAGGTVTVKVRNWREADLVELQAAESGSANWKKVLGALKAGQWTSAKSTAGQQLSRGFAREIRRRSVGGCVRCRYLCGQGSQPDQLTRQKRSIHIKRSPLSRSSKPTLPNGSEAAIVF